MLSRPMLAAWLGGVLLLHSTPVARCQCEVHKLTEAGAALAAYGACVSHVNDDSAVGMPGDDFHPTGAVGSVFLYRQTDGGGSKAVKVVASDASISLLFGRSVAIKGDTALVGAPFSDAGAPNGGAAYVFSDAGGRWSELQKIWPSDSAHGGNFGFKAALSGSTALITAFNDNHGKAYIFERDANGVWIEKQKLIPIGWMGLDYYGRSAAIDGDVAVVGAPVDTEFGFSAGAAHVFERQRDGTWQHVAKLTAPDAGGMGWFGMSVAVQGNTVVVGASSAKVGGLLSVGAVYVFGRDANGDWSQKEKLIASDGTNTDWFGRAVAIDGDVLVVAAPGDDDRAPQAGSLYVFTRDAAGAWKQTAKLLASDGSAEDRLGDDQSLAVSGNRCLVGAWRADPYGENSGSAYLFAVGPDADGDGVMDACVCPGDIDKNWMVNQGDLGILLADYGCTGGIPVPPPDPPDPDSCAGDLDADGDTDQADLGILLANYGAVCP